MSVAVLVFVASPVRPRLTSHNGALELLSLSAEVEWKLNTTTFHDATTFTQQVRPCHASWPAVSRQSIAIVPYHLVPLHSASKLFLGLRFRLHASIVSYLHPSRGSPMRARRYSHARRFHPGRDTTGKPSLPRATMPRTLRSSMPTPAGLPDGRNSPEKEALRVWS